MAQGINRYKADLRELRFVLFEQFHAEEFLGQGPFANWGAEEARLVLDEAHRLGCEVTGPINAAGDAGCHVENGEVKTPEGFKEAWAKVREAGFKLLTAPPEYGGQGAPLCVGALVGELSTGPNTSLDMYSGLSIGAAELIATFGTPAQQRLYCERMFTCEWGGTMCLTEPQAGSDVGEAKTLAKKQPDGTYKLTGSKVFISGGDQDLTENIVHMVLARTEGAPRGTKGLSLFIVPKRRVEPSSGALTGPNDVKVAAIEHKMGINGSSTCALQFGDDDACVGELLGVEEHQGMRQMFQMMNFARVGVALQGLGIASTAYLNALAYAKERKQGCSVTAWRDPEAPRVPIIEHPDVRRMLLDMKARVEGIRALVMLGATSHDRARLLETSDPEEAEHHRGRLELLTPLMKAYSSDQSFRICETAIQVLGGAGYTKDFPVEQYCRDSKIFSIYEGTNHIQALDLVGRKLGLAGGTYAQHFLGDIGAFIDTHEHHPVLGDSIKHLDQARHAVATCGMQFLTWFQGGKLTMVPLVANRFLKMMSELAVGWLLLEGAVIALDAQKKLTESDPDWSFYEGKKHAAMYFAGEVLPEVAFAGQLLQHPARNPLDIPEAAFATEAALR